MSQSRSFTKKSIEIEIVLASGDFGGGNTKIIRGQPTVVSISKPGEPEKSSANVTITGLSLASMEQMTTLSFRALESEKNLITIKAGEEGGEMSVAFKGEISSAVSNFTNAPDVVMDIESMTGFYPQRISEPPLSTNGEQLASDLIAQLANSIGYTFINNGVSASVNNAVFNGSPLEKIGAISRQIGAELIIDDMNIIIQNRESVREGSIPLLRDNSGLVGYPTFNNDGIVARCFYRPEIVLGGSVKIESIVPKASGTWKITKLEHSLEAYTPRTDGDWFTGFEGQYVGS